MAHHINVSKLFDRILKMFRRNDVDEPARRFNEKHEPMPMTAADYVDVAVDGFIDV